MCQELGCGLWLKVPDPTLRMWISTLTIPAKDTKTVSVNPPSLFEDNLPDVFCLGTMDINCLQFVQMKYVILRTLENYYLKY